MVQKQDFEHLTESEIGSRPPKDSTLHAFISVIAFTWSLFQLWVASPIQFDVASFFGSNAILLNDAQVRAIHLSFGIFLVFLLFPALGSSPTKYVPFQDWLFAIFAVLASLYVCVFYGKIALRLGIPNGWDISFGLVGVVLLLEAARRTVGTAITVIATLFLAYSHFGEIMPEMIIHKDYSLSAIISHQWLSAEGVFGTALGVSADFVFLYVLFGVLLEKTGAGSFFIQLSFALLGRFRGGPAKAAVVSSGLMGMISGSSIANTITVGSLTIPLMKKMGFKAEKAAAIEVSSGVNGQIMPPVMGAAAFLMAEYLAIPYTEVIKHSFLPAILIYIALLYIVHIEACKLGIEPTHKSANGYFIFGVLKFLLSFFLVAIIAGFVYFLIEGCNYFIGIKNLAGNYSPYVICLFIFIVYVSLLAFQAKCKRTISVNDIGENLDVWVVLRCGLHNFLPIVILIWCLLVERISPALSAYWTILFLMFELFTKKIITEFFAGRCRIKEGLYFGLNQFVDSMIMGAKNMTVVAIATATAGIIVGSVSLTGIGLKISGILDYISNGNFLITLFLTAAMCVILGMGMPTTACYIIVATLMVPVLKYITDKNAVYVPPFALHLFVFYFGLMADVTPPVGLASYAAAAIAGANAITTGVQAFLYNIRTMILPFLFIYNPEILSYGVNGFASFMQIFVFSVIGIITITAGTQNYFITRSKFYESALLLLLGICAICPQIPTNIVSPPFKKVEMNNDTLSVINPGDKLKFTVSSKNFFGKEESKDVIIDSKSETSIAQQLNGCGLSVVYDNETGSAVIKDVVKKKESRCSNIEPSSRIIFIGLKNKQISRLFIYLFSIILLLSVIILQKKRS